ncbi:MAG: type I 3-dehydroquinate dehydratase, partial [Acidobacteria bacterium]
MEGPTSYNSAACLRAGSPSLYGHQVLGGQGEGSTMRSPMLCETVAEPTAQALRAARDSAAERADLVELRLDAMEHPDVAAALEGRQGPVIVTCRPRWEGGGFDGPEEHRIALLDEALRLGAD